MHDCDHVGARHYVRRTFSNGTTHIGVQCLRCLRIVKLPQHDCRLWIRASEVPPGKTIHEWIDPADVA